MVINNAVKIIFYDAFGIKKSIALLVESSSLQVLKISSAVLHKESTYFMAF